MHSSRSGLLFGSLVAFFTVVAGCGDDGDDGGGGSIAGMGGDGTGMSGSGTTPSTGGSSTGGTTTPSSGGSAGEPASTAGSTSEAGAEATGGAPAQPEGGAAGMVEGGAMSEAGAGPGPMNCFPGLTNCDGECVNTDNNEDNCGACGNACDSGEVCDGNGNCEAGCNQGLVLCGGQCIDPDTSEDYCGASGDCSDMGDGNSSGVTCEGDEVCDGNGECSIECDPGLIVCDGQCIDPDTDDNYCGASGNCTNQGFFNNRGEECTDGAVCDGNGNCAIECDEGLIACEGECIDPDTDDNHCGASGNCQGPSAGEACGPGELCDGQGNCLAECQEGLVNCEGECINPDIDERFCGADPNNDGSCEPGTAGMFGGGGTPDTNGDVCGGGEICDGGECVPNCSAGEVACQGECVNPQTNPEFCGAAGDCTNVGGGNSAGQNCTNTSQACVGGSCATQCSGGTVLCGDSCINPTNDPDFCGATAPCQAGGMGTADTNGEVCGSNESCSGGNCTCNEGFIDCGNDGCINPETDEGHCGALGTCVGSGTTNNVGDDCRADETCVLGTCQCTGGEIDCDGACIDPDNDEDYCGASGPCNTDETDGEVCATNALCTGGSCQCPAGEIVCEGTCIDPLTNNTYCGAEGDCSQNGVECEAGVEECVAGSCQPIST